MTREDLEQIYYLKLDIKRLEQRLEEKLELERVKAEKATQVLSPTSGAGSSNDVKSKQEKFVDVTDKYIAEYTGKVNKRKKELESRVRAAEEFIDTVPDPRMRLILEYRCIKNLHWSDVAREIGGYNTVDSVRKAYERFMQTL